MRIVFDLDGTLCTKTDGDYQNAQPIVRRIKKVNDLHSAGNEIVIFTARGMSRNKGNVEKSVADFMGLTREQLQSWGVKYDELILGKPAADFYVDDKGVSDVDFFKD